MRTGILLSTIALAALACAPAKPVDKRLDADPPLTSASAPSILDQPADYSKLDRATFNRMAMRLNAPIYWLWDQNGDGKPDPDEIKSLLFFPITEKWSVGGKFTKAFDVYYKRLVDASKAPEPTDERARLVRKELDAASSSLIYTDLRGASDETKEVVRHVLAATNALDELYAHQIGIVGLRDQLPLDEASQSLFRRNWGPGCATPGLDQDPKCSAIPGINSAQVDVYPAELQQGDDACTRMEKDATIGKLLSPFTVIRKTEKGYVAKGYNEVYGDLMRRVAKELRLASKAITSTSEAAFKTYLDKAADGFESNNWDPADVAWAAMDSHNSKFYLRIAPDETGWDPCSKHAGFQVSFAFIDPNGVALQDKLQPKEQDMEDAVAKVIGNPYTARKVSFHLPDFINIIANGGEARSAIGGTIGESLPNWGPLTENGAGRTVAMSNLYDDPDSRAVRRAKADSLFTADMMKYYPTDKNIGSLATVLHEAMHNLGPNSEYKLNGQKTEDMLGGDNAAMYEEAKAQTGGLYLLDVLQKKGLFTEEEVKQTYLDSMVWAMNHISRGMWRGSGASRKRKPYSQLAAIQVFYFIEQKALIWDEKAPAANGKDVGAFRIDFEKMPSAILNLTHVVGNIKAKGDRKVGEDVAKKYVEGTQALQDIIKERCLRFAQPNFVYGIDWE
ncbi:MAG: hypothetical protein U0414_30075 [Polyangiaceae bacterium]